MVLEESVEPFATPSLSSVLAVLRHRIEESCRRGLEEEGVAIPALRKARMTLDRLAIFEDQKCGCGMFSWSARIRSFSLVAVAA